MQNDAKSCENRSLQKLRYLENEKRYAQTVL